MTQNLFLAFGGLGLFLFGLKMLSDGLKNIAGSRMRTIIGKATANRVLGLLVGAAVTAVTQSSTATSVMSISFVNAGLMNLNQFASIIIGASVGTTLTAFLFSFRIDQFAPLFIFLGVCFYLFLKRKRDKAIGFTVLSLGILFYGLSMMGAPLRELSQLDGFQRLLTAFQNPFLALLAGIIFTAIVQSSTATIGVIIAMYLGGVYLSFETAAFLVIGANIGTCSTALLSSLAADRESKRAALIMLFYKMTAGSIFTLAILSIPGILTWFQARWPDGAMQVAMFHTVYNLAAAGVMIFFTRHLVALVCKLVPRLPQEENARQLLHLGKERSPTPETTFTQTHSELCRMGKIAFDNLKLAQDAFFDRNAEKAVEVFETEETVDYLKREITAHLMRVQSDKLTSNDVEKLSAMLQIVSDIERLGDHAENIAEYVLNEWNHSVNISGQALNELRTLCKAMMDTLALTLEAFEYQDSAQLPHILELEQMVDDLSERYLKNHIERLETEQCDPRCGVVFTSMISDLERCSDHAINIAEKVGLTAGIAAVD